MSFWKRALTAVVLIPLAVALVLWAPAWLFALAVAVVGVGTLGEYLELAGRLSPGPSRLVVYLTALALWSVALWAPAQVWPALLGACLVILVATMFRRQGLADVVPASAAGVFGLVYIAVPIALLLLLRAGEGGRWVLLYLLLLVWSTDTFAYFGGHALGRHKLAPRISPGKTVEGTAVSIVVTVAVGYWLFRLWFPGASAAHALLLPLIVNIVAQVGDLAESALKRSAGVKDSSGLLPGHGGLLDRIDALLFAIPALWYYWSLLLWRTF